MTKRSVITRATSGNFVIGQPITRLVRRPVDALEIFAADVHNDPRSEPPRRDTSQTPVDLARAAIWRPLPRLDVTVLEALIVNGGALVVAVRGLAAIVTEKSPNPARLRAVLREAHCRGVDTVLGIETIRDAVLASRVLR